MATNGIVGKLQCKIQGRRLELEDWRAAEALAATPELVEHARRQADYVAMVLAVLEASLRKVARRRNLPVEPLSGQA